MCANQNKFEKINNDHQNQSAFIAIVGNPNVGKSSLLNSMLGHKISIVSNKPQTTRTRITGILTIDETQLVFIDTPGLHKPKTSLGKYMVKSINQSVLNVDACMLVVEAGKEINQQEIGLINKFKEINMPTILVINKIDLIKDKSILIDQINKFSQLFNFESVLLVSAQKNDGIQNLIDELKKQTQPGGHFFDDDSITDQPEKVIFSEIIREKLLKFLDKEIPHGVAVDIEMFKHRDDGITDIHAVIYCEKESHKGIIIGKKGTLLKKIGTFARLDIENFFDYKVNLKLWVKVKEDWRNRERLLNSFGFDNKNFS